MYQIFFYVRQNEEKLRPHLPTIMSSVLVACRRMRRHISMVKIVLPLLKTDVNELISAAIMTATIKPRTPRSNSPEEAGS